MITETTIYNHLITQWLVGITALKTKPHAKVEPTGNYVYVGRLSDNPDSRWLWWLHTRRSRFEFTIVCKKELWAGESAIDILNWYVEELISIYDKKCNTDFISQFASVSPVLYREDDRPMIIVDFIFNYS